jgi:post-segregation antitoxin (ccd killing protein)
LSTDNTTTPALPPQLAELLKGNEAARQACREALQAAFQAGQGAGWTQGYAEGRAVTAAYIHASGCTLNHPGGEPCEVQLHGAGSPEVLLRPGQPWTALIDPAPHREEPPQ